MKYDRLTGYLESVKNTVYVEPKIDYHEKIIDQAFDAYVKHGSFTNVLDIGFGTGYSLDKFKALGINVVGITMCESELNPEYDTRLMDMHFLDFEDETFDLIWCRHTLEHSIMPFVALNEFKRVMKPCGYLYVEVPQDEAVHVDNPNHYSMLSDRSWQALMRKAGLKLLNRGQFVIHLDNWTDIYWNYWLKKEMT